MTEKQATVYWCGTKINYRTSRLENRYLCKLCGRAVVKRKDDCVPKHRCKKMVIVDNIYQETCPNSGKEWRE